MNFEFSTQAGLSTPPYLGFRFEIFSPPICYLLTPNSFPAPISHLRNASYLLSPNYFHLSPPKLEHSIMLFFLNLNLNLN